MSDGTPISQANLAPSKNDVIAAIIQKELAKQSVFLPYVTDYSRFMGKGMKTFSILKRSVVTAQNLDVVNGNDTNTFALTQDTMTPNKLPYVSFTITEPDEIESVVSLDAEAARAAASAIARHIDDSIIAALISGAGYSHVTDGLGSATVTRDSILAMRKFVRCNYAPNDLVLAISCDDEHDGLLKQAEFTEQQIYGSSAVPSGMVARLYGMPVVVSEGLNSGQAFVFSKSALGYASHLGVGFKVSDAPDFGARALRYTWSAKYALDVLQKGELGVDADESPWIAKLEAEV